EVLNLYDWYTRLTGKTLDQEGLARPHRTTDQVAHWQRLKVGLPPEGDILAKPGFKFVLAVKIIECSFGIDELDEVAAILFHKGFLQNNKITRLDSLVGVFLELDQFFD